MAAGRRRAIEQQFADRARFTRRAFLLLPGVGQRPAYDEYVIAHRIRAAQLMPELGFSIPTLGQPYPSSSLPPQLLALRVQDEHPQRLPALEDALFRAVFVALDDVADPTVLRRCAREAEVPEGEVDRALADPALPPRALREHEQAIERGITGIPAMLVPGQVPLVGAQPLEAYRSALERALARRRPDGP